MTVFLPLLVVGAMLLVVASQVRAQGKTREASLITGLSIVLLVASLAGAGLALAREL